MALDPEDWKLVSEWFLEAIELDPDRRRAFLEGVAKGRGNLVTEVEAWIVEHESENSILDEPALGPDFELGEDPLAETAIRRLGQRLGAYRLVSVIESGGMGTVFLAERADAQFDKRVAIKLMRSRALSDASREHFLREQQALAQLQHPHIAQLLDGGTAEGGLPYLVMEYIDGEPIDVWCDRSRLSVAERLRLFQKVCAAVHHAHRNLIVHRDIKPGNVLVTREGIPKLLDFGIAKILEPDKTVAVTTQRFLTPGYASPEQVLGEPITISSDVYSLGVLLYELLVGQVPYGEKGSASTHAMRRMLEEEPVRPSVALQQLASDVPRAEVVTRARACRPDRLPKLLAGDLDWVVLMALRKEPDRRYASAEQFAADIERHLGSHPVLARKDTIRYRTAKFVRRNQVSVVATILLLAALAWGYLGTEQALVQARFEAASKERTIEWLNGMILDFDPIQGPRSEVTLRQILDQAADLATIELEGQPSVQLSLMKTLAGGYQSLGLYRDELPWRCRVVELVQTLPESDELSVARCRFELGDALARAGDHAAARDSHQEALRVRRESFETPHRDIADSLARVAATRWRAGDYETPPAMFADAESMLGEVLDGPHRDLVLCRLDWGSCLHEIGDYSAAHERFVGALEMSLELTPEAPLLVARSRRAVGGVLHDMGRYEEAWPYYQAAFEMLRDTLGEEHTQTVNCTSDLSLLAKDMGDYDTALTYAISVLAVRRRELGDDHPLVASGWFALAKVHADSRKWAEAEEACVEALSVHARVMGEAHPRTAGPMTLLGRILIERGRASEALPLLRRAYSVRRDVLPTASWKTAKTASILGAALTSLGRYDEAEPLVVESLAVITADRGPDHHRTAQAVRRVAELYEAAGQPARARAYRERLAEILAANPHADR